MGGYSGSAMSPGSEDSQARIVDLYQLFSFFDSYHSAFFMFTPPFFIYRALRTQVRYLVLELQSGWKANFGKLTTTIS